MTKNRERPELVEEIGPCFCGKPLELLRLPHPYTGVPTLALSHVEPMCDRFVEDLPLDVFLASLRKHRQMN